MSAPQKRKIVVTPQKPYSSPMGIAAGTVAMKSPPAAVANREAVSSVRAGKRSASAPPGKYEIIAVMP